MPRNHPKMLKLFAGDTAAEGGFPSTGADWDDVARAFHSATGWRLAEGALCDGLAADTPPKGEATKGVLRDERADSAIEHSKALALAEVIGRIYAERDRARGEARRQSAELATAIPVTVRPDDACDLADRLGAVLRGGARGIGCTAAALYLLDEATSKLSLRVQWGLPERSDRETTRPLAAALADLEALLGHAVVLDNAAAAPQWKCPEPCASAVCVPVLSRATQLGTLWFYCERLRNFDDRETELAEIIAGRIAAELEREVLAEQATRRQSAVAGLADVARWRRDQSRRQPPLLDNWRVAAYVPESDDLEGDFVDWWLTDDGQLDLAVAAPREVGVSAGLFGAALQSAWRTHCCLNTPPQQILQEMESLLWSMFSGDRIASTFLATVREDAVNFAAAGHVLAAIRNGSTVLPLDLDQPPLGEGAAQDLEPQVTRLRAGECLWVVAAGEPSAFSRADARRRMEHILGSRTTGASSLTALARQLAHSLAGSGRGQRSPAVLALLRR